MKNRKLLYGVLCVCLVAVITCGCNKNSEANIQDNESEKVAIAAEEEEPDEPETEEIEEIPEPETEEIEEMEDILEPEDKILVVIDAGHQEKGNFEKEPIGPGAEETKPKVAGGTRGCVTGVPEYQLTLEISLKLGEELEKRGYEVLYTRTSNEVDISNAERATIANDANADVFIRIHANGSENSSVQGAMTICQTKNNRYNGNLYEQSKELSEKVLDHLVESTGCKKERVWETDTMSGINWCNVPVSIVEVGYMTNPEEDRLLNDEVYQEKIVQGIANGIDDVKYLDRAF